MKTPYHSALKPEIDLLPPLDYFQNGKDLVFQHDVTNGIPVIYSVCDVIYSEPAWKDGYEKFVNRSNLPSGNYLLYILQLNHFIENTAKPVYLVLGSHVLKEFKKPNWIVPIKLHGYATNLCIWNDVKLVAKTNYEAIELLSRKYNKVGDFNAGYGNTARIFNENGKNFVCSDLNPKCVYYIAKTFMNYE